MTATTTHLNCKEFDMTLTYQDSDLTEFTDSLILTRETRLGHSRVPDQGG